MIKKFIEKAQEIWDEFTTGKGKKSTSNLHEDKRQPNRNNQVKGQQLTSLNSKGSFTIQKNGSTTNFNATRPFFNKPASGYLVRD